MATWTGVPTLRITTMTTAATYRIMSSYPDEWVLLDQDDLNVNLSRGANFTAGGLYRSAPSDPEDVDSENVAEVLVAAHVPDWRSDCNHRISWIRRSRTPSTSNRLSTKKRLQNTTLA